MSSPKIDALHEIIKDNILSFGPTRDRPSIGSIIDSKTQLKHCDVFLKEVYSAAFSKIRLIYFLIVPDIFEVHRGTSPKVFFGE
jgi:hypothetical protein